MHRCGGRMLFCLVLAVNLGCQEVPPARTVVTPTAEPPEVQRPVNDVANAEIRLLFVGNSHTTSYQLPALVRDMIRFRQPGKKVASYTFAVGFLEDAARNPMLQQLLGDFKWTCVILQAQKISMSGRFNYSRKEGIELAQRAKTLGANVFFYPEWGLRGKPGDGERQAKIYREMATAAGVGIAPISQAWDLALAERPKLPLYEADGNHQSSMGAFLTACVLFGTLTGDSPSALADFPYSAVEPGDRRFLAERAAQALKTHGTKPPAVTPAATPSAATPPAANSPAFATRTQFDQ